MADSEFAKTYDAYLKLMREQARKNKDLFEKVGDTMNKEEVLREQIKELEKLLELKDKRIAELEKPSVTITSQFGTIPAPCKKCGYSPEYTITYSDSCSGDSAIKIT